MGREAFCEVSFGTRTSRGKALLETKELLFRGDFRVVVPFADMTSVSADASLLTVTWSGGTLRLALGAEAARWADKIRNPPGRLDKLGVKAGMAVALAGGRGDAESEAFSEELAARGAHVVKKSGDADLVFAVVDTQADLKAVAKVIAGLRPDAGLWVLRKKGKHAVVGEAAVRSAARAAGLVDVKVAAFSDTRTADKFVVPAAKRAKKVRAK
jgi:hypothetical protein